MAFLLLITLTNTIFGTDDDSSPINKYMYYSISFETSKEKRQINQRGRHFITIYWTIINRLHVQ